METVFLDKYSNYKILSSNQKNIKDIESMIHAK